MAIRVRFKKSETKADAEHWITLHPNGKEAKGTPALINGAGQIIGGAGGKLTGKVVQPKSKSASRPGTEEQHAPAIWLGPAKPEQPKPEEPGEAPAAAQVNKPDPQLQKMEAKLAEAKQILEMTGKMPDFMRKGMEEDIAKREAEIEAYKKAKEGATGTQAPAATPTPAPAPTEAPKPAEPAAAPAPAPAPVEPPKPVEAPKPEKPKTKLEELEEKADVLAEKATDFAGYKEAYQAYKEAQNEIYSGRASGDTRKIYDKMSKMRDGMSNAANELSANAKTKEEHIAAMAAHEDVYRISKYTSLERAHALKYHEHKKAVTKMQTAERREQAKAEKKAGIVSPAAKAEAKFKSTPVAEIKSAFKEQYGVELAHPEGARFEHEAVSEFMRTAKYRALSPEEKAKVNEQYKETWLRAQSEGEGSHGSLPRGGKFININDGSTAAKNMRKMLGHYDSTLSGLTEKGYDIKAALSKSNVQIASASVKGVNGVMWRDRERGKNCVAVSLTKRLDAAAIQKQKAQAESRKAQGKPRWSLSSSSQNPARATIIHEMTHAIGLHGDRRSDQRLDGILGKLYPNLSERQAWIRNTISEYATTNIRETDAEIATMVMEPDYVRGTLPKEIEDHVDWLFMKKG